MPYATNPKEVIKKIPLNTASVAAAQSQIENCRLENPEGVYVMVLKGNLTVQSVPLILGSKVFLEMAEDASITAADNATADCLIKIEKSEQVTVFSKSKKGGQLKGNAQVKTGISVLQGSRINFDQIQFTNFTDALKIESIDNALVSQAVGVTRCGFTKVENGIIANKSNGLVALDNHFNEVSKIGIRLAAETATIAGNRFENVSTAILYSGAYSVFTRNFFTNCATTFESTAESKNAFLSQNQSSGSDTKIILAGNNQIMCDNGIQGEVVSTPAENTRNLLFKNPNLKTNSAASRFIFNPPTIKNPHKENMIIPGWGRTDVVINGDKGSDKTKWTDLASVQKKADEAREHHATDFVVIHLNGNFVSRNPEGLTMPNNSAVILDGTILADTGTPQNPPYVKADKPMQLVQFPLQGWGSFSGGKLDANRQVFYCIRSSSGKADHGLIDEVSIVNGARDGVYTKGRNSKAGLIFLKNNFSNNGGRALWAHVSGPTYAVENYLETSGKDGIDLDAGAKFNVCLYNTAVKNRRHGVFIEEGSHHNLVFGNELNENLGAGVHVWNEEVNANTTNNSIVANVCNGNRRGLTCGGRDATKISSNNLFFNNECARNTEYGIGTGNRNGINNYFSQSIVKDNKTMEVQFNEVAQPFFLNIPAH